MKNCIACNQEIENEVNFCPNCGEKQPQQIDIQEEATSAMHQDVGNKPVVIIIVLAILTICGSLFTIGRAFLYEMVGSIASDEGIQIRAGIYVLASIGTIIGAVMMLLKKLTGLYVYTACQILYIITTVFAAMAHNTKDNLASVILFFFAAPSILFLILYWLKDVRKHLK